MEVNFRQNYSCNYIQPKPHSIDKPERRGYSSFPKCSPAYFSPSFTAAKNNEYKGIDKFVIEKFNAPVQTFRSINDFNDWANKQSEAIIKKDYSGRQDETTIQRNSILEEWKNYIFKENKEYTPAQRLLIFDGITQGLNKDSDTIPPNLNKRVLADTIYNLEETLKREPNKKNYNFNKTYQNNLRSFYIQDIDNPTGDNSTGWIKIPSKNNDRKHFNENVEKLKTLSHPTWCTKSYNAEPYLEEGDFHVYLENGKTKLGIRFKDGKIEEIQGPKNDGKLPIMYYDECVSYINQNKFKLSSSAKKEIGKTQYLKEKYIPTIDKIKNAKTNEEEIFKILKIQSERDENGMLILSHFDLSNNMKSDGISYEDLGININKLMKNVKEIKGRANFRKTDLHNLPNLETIGGNAYFNNLRINNLSKLKTIGGDADFEHANIDNANSLTTIKERANFSSAQVKALGNLTEIGGTANFNHAAIENLSALKTIGKDADFRDSQVIDLSALTEIGGNASFSDTNITSLNALKTIGGDANFNESLIEDLPNLTEIGGHANFEGSKIKNLNSLTKIMGWGFFNNTSIKDLPNIKYIKLKFSAENSSFDENRIKYFENISLPEYKDSLSKLKTTEDIFQYLNINAKKNEQGLYTLSHFHRPEFMEKDMLTFNDLGIDVESLMENACIIENDADFSNTNIRNLPNLTEVGGELDLSFHDSIGNVGRLKTIGGNADFVGSKIKNMKNLTTIEGSAFFNRAEIDDLSSLTTIGDSADFSNAKIGNLDGLAIIGEDADFSEMNISGIPNLRKIEGSASFYKARIGDLGKLYMIGDNANFGDAIIDNLGNLRLIGGFADFDSAEIGDLSHLAEIRDGADFEDAKIPALPNLYYIRKNYKFKNAEIKGIKNIINRIENYKEKLNKARIKAEKIARKKEKS